MSARSKPGWYAEVKARLLTSPSPWETEALSILCVVGLLNKAGRKA